MLINEILKTLETAPILDKNTYNNRENFVKDSTFVSLKEAFKKSKNLALNKIIVEPEIRNPSKNIKDNMTEKIVLS